MFSYSCKYFHIKTSKFTKLTIFMQQMQYNASNIMYVFQKISGVTPLNPVSYWDPESSISRALPLQNPGSTPKDIMETGNWKCKWMSCSHGKVTEVDGYASVDPDIMDSPISGLSKLLAFLQLQVDDNASAACSVKLLGALVWMSDLLCCVYMTIW